MIHFQWPLMALLLLIPLWQAKKNRRLRLQHEKRTSLLHPHIESIQSAFQTHRPRLAMHSWLYSLLVALVWIGVILALMRPQYLKPYTENKVKGYDLMLAVDASHSMEALDFRSNGRQVSRMQVVKGVMGEFIAERKNDRVGLIIFGNQAFVLSPLTLDQNTVKQLLEQLTPRIAGDGTAMGDAIALGVKKLRQRPAGSRVLILVADGESTAGLVPPLEAAEMARIEGIRIYTIGVGSHQKNVPIVEGGRLITRDDLGFDEAVMKKIAALTGGAYFRASDTQALQKISAKINELEASQAESRTIYIPYPLYQYPLGLALFAFLWLGLFPDARSRYIRE